MTTPNTPASADIAREAAEAAWKVLFQFRSPTDEYMAALTATIQEAIARDRTERDAELADAIEWKERYQRTAHIHARDADTLARKLAEREAELLSWKGNCERMCDQHGELSAELGIAKAKLAEQSATIDRLNQLVSERTEAANDFEQKSIALNAELLALRALLEKVMRYRRGECEYDLRDIPSDQRANYAHDHWQDIENQIDAALNSPTQKQPAL